MITERETRLGQLIFAAELPELAEESSHIKQDLIPHVSKEIEILKEALCVIQGDPYP